jgi:hypothetical protein
MSIDFSNLQKVLLTAKGRGNELAQQIHDVMTLHQQGPISNIGSLMPLLFFYNGKPLSLQGHFTMEPLFDLDAPRNMTLMCSRQVGKSMNLTARALMNAAWTPHWNTLFVAPFFETIRRISTDYFATLIEQSPSRGIFTGPKCTKQVLERTLPNQSRIRFTYAHRNADRARGIHARELVCDEYQLMMPDVMPVLTATMDASEYGDYIMRAGTPLTNSNHLTIEFKENSSRSHWMIPCEGCGHKNIAAEEYDLLGMIGPLRQDISIDRPGVVCSKCRNPIFPWLGRFVHLNPSKRGEHLGLHVPSPILPMHCCNYQKWEDLHFILSNPNVPTYTKYNESLGVPFDDGVLLLTQKELSDVCVLNKNRIDDALQLANRYDGRIAIGIDWGGRGISGESLTKFCVAGLNSDGKIHAILGIQLPKTADSRAEATVLTHLWKVFKPQFIAHDNLGIGARAEEMMINAGVPATLFRPMEYAGETQGDILAFKPATQDRPKAVTRVDKTRGLLHLIEAIKCKQVLMFQRGTDLHADHCLLDLTHLRAEERVWVASVKSETILIQKEPGKSDDFAHALHHAANQLWSAYNAWPRLAKQLLIKTPQELTTYMSELAQCVDPETLEQFAKEVLDVDTSTGA